VHVFEPLGAFLIAVRVLSELLIVPAPFRAKSR